MDRLHDPAGFGIEAELGAGIPDLGDRLPHEVLDVDAALGGDLAGYYDKAGGQERFARHAAHGVLGKKRVKDGIGNLVGYFVRVPLGNRFRGKKIVSAAGAHLVSSRPFGP